MPDVRMDELPQSEAQSPPLLRLWFGVRDEVPRHLYAVSGLGLMAFKYVVEFATAMIYAGRTLMPWDFLNPLLSSRIGFIQQGPEWLPWALFVWTLPFVWIAFSMSVRRAANAGRSPWLGMLVLVPLLNLIVMVCLALLPDALERHWQPDSHIVPKVDDRPDDGGYAGLIAIGAGLFTGLVMFGLSIYILDTYGTALFLGTPLVMGSVTGFLFNRPRRHSWSATFAMAFFLMLAAGATLLLFALEGIVCLAMAAPIVLPLGLIGAFVGKAIADAHRTTTRHMISAMLALPLLAGMESLQPAPPTYVVLTAVEINAPPEEVWPYVVEFPDLSDPEEWYFKTGIACPLRARIDGKGVGATRYCEFTTGTFVEPITVWHEPHRLAFDVTDQPEPMRELSPYRHVHPPHMEHESLRSQRGEFKLISLEDGRTRLEGRTWYTFEMFPQAYWTLWSDSCIHRIHVRVLEHVKGLAESNGSQLPVESAVEVEHLD